jgi:peroxiredoxin
MTRGAMNDPNLHPMTQPHKGGSRIDGDGVIRKVFEQVKPAGHAEEVLAELVTVRVG